MGPAGQLLRRKRPAPARLSLRLPSPAAAGGSRLSAAQPRLVRDKCSMAVVEAPSSPAVHHRASAGVGLRRVVAAVHIACIAASVADVFTSQVT